MAASTKTLDLLHKYSFGGLIYSCSAIQWSEDNKIILCTDEGLYVLTSYCSPLEAANPFTLHKQFIPNAKKTQKFDIAFNRLDLHTYLPKDELHSLMMDHTLSPKIGGAANFQSYKYAQWSPMGAAGFRQCLLAAMTYDHRLVLYEEIHGNYEALFDLSDLYYDHCKTEWGDKELLRANSIQEAVSLYYKVKERSYRMAATVMIWTHVFDMDITSLGKWCYLLVGTKSGHLILWRIIWSREVRAEIAGEWKGNLAAPKSLHWQPTGRASGFLVIGCHSGVVVLLCITESTNEAKRSCPSISEMLYLWKDKDRVIPSCITVLKQSKTNYIVVFTKGKFLGTCEIVISNLELKVQKVSCVAGLHALPSTGLSVIEKHSPQRSFLVTSMDGRTVKVVIRPSDRSILLDQEELNLTSNDPKFAPKGVTTSPNHMVHAVVYNIAPQVDHLVRREPLQMMLFSLKSLPEAVDTLETQMRELVLAPFCTTFADIMDLLKAKLCGGIPAPDFFLDLVDSDWLVQNLSMMQLIRYVLKGALSGIFLIGDTPENQRDKLEAIEILIMKNYCMNTCSMVVSRMDKLTKLQKVSFSLMSDWLGNNYKVAVTEIDMDDYTESIKERCRICKEPIGLTSVFSGSCSRGHRFARCCHSLLLCDSGSYLKCLSCKAIALKDNIWNLKPYCSLCGMIMV